MTEPVHIRTILPGVFHGIRRLYEQAHGPEPDGRDIIQDLRAQIREKAIGRRGKSPGNCRQFLATLGNSRLRKTATIMISRLIEGK